MPEALYPIVLLSQWRNRRSSNTTSCSQARVPHPVVQPSVFYYKCSRSQAHTPQMSKRGDRNHKGHTFLRNHHLGSSKINTTESCPPHLKSKKKTHQNTTINNSHSLPGHGSDVSAEHREVAEVMVAATATPRIHQPEVSRESCRVMRIDHLHLHLHLRLHSLHPPSHDQPR
jgi:hypothetical protein